VGAAVLVISLAVRFVHHRPWLTGFETAAFDSFLVLRSAPQRSTDVVIVEIDDRDYAELFDNRSPLEAAEVERLVAAIVAGGAQVVGVDLDTSAPEFQRIDPARWPQVIWAREARFHEEKIEPLPVLGGPEVAAGRSGIAAVPQDADCRVRRYRRVFETTGGPLPSFAHAVVSAYRGDRASGQAEEELDLNFFGDRYDFDATSAREVLAGAAQPGWRRNGPFRGRIVLLGGTYAAARDRHYTPLDREGEPTSGVEVMAHAIESDLRGGGIRPANELLMMAIELLASLLIVFINHRYLEKDRVGRALFWSLTLSFVVAPIGSFLAFRTLAYWASFVPILVGVTIHQLYENAVHYRELLHQKDAGEEGTAKPPPVKTRPANGRRRRPRHRRRP
jgi:CHASE2 domain-containing sensor protein